MADVATSTPYMRAKQLADALNVSKSTIWNWTRKGIIPKPTTLGRCTVWDTEEVFNYIKRFKDVGDVEQQ